MPLAQVCSDGCDEKDSRAEPAKTESEKSSRYFFVSIALS